jgi:hypothetical protein
VQLSVAPLRPVRLREAIAVLKKRFRPFISTMIRVLIRLTIGYALLIVPGLIMSIRYALYAPVVLIEGWKRKRHLNDLVSWVHDPGGQSSSFRFCR